MITVERWISPAEAEGKPERFGGMGGGFGVDINTLGRKKSMRWRDYLEARDASEHPYAEALRSALLVRGRITGDDHQSANDGVPMFSDGSVATFSLRGWGDLLAAVYSERDNKDYCYMDFYYIYWPFDEPLGASP